MTPNKNDLRSKDDLKNKNDFKKGDNLENDRRQNSMEENLKLRRTFYVYGIRPWELIKQQKTTKVRY